MSDRTPRQTPPPSRRSAYLFLASNALVNISVGAIGVLYTLYLQRLGYGTDFFSALLVVGIAGAGLGLIPANIAARRFSARKLLLWSDLIGGLAAAGQLLFPQPALLLATTFVVGASASIFIVLTPPILASITAPEDRARIFSLNATLGFLTSVLGTLIGGFLPELTRLPGVLESFPVRLATPWLVGGAARPLQLAVLLGGALGIPTIWPLFLMEDRVIGAPQTPATGERPAAGRWQPGAWLAAWQARWQRPATQIIARFLTYEALLGFGAGLFLTYLNLYFIEHLGVSTAVFGVVSSASTVLLALATLAGPRLGRRLGDVRGAVLAQMLSVPLLVGMALAGNVPLVIVFFLGRSMLMNMGQPLLQSFVMGALPPAERGPANSAFNVGWQVMLAAGGVLSGLVITRFGYGPTFFGAAACYLGGMLVLTPWFGREQAMVRGVEAPTATPRASG